MMEESVIVEQVGKVQLIAINRGHRRNAVNRDVSERIARALEELDSNPDLTVGVITGRGGSFCSGMDLKDFADGSRPELEGYGFAGITEKPPVKPVIAAVEGYALAGGFEVVLACDLVVASETAVFGLPEVCRGLVAGSGGLVRLPTKIPVSVALEYALTGENMSATIAHQWGLVNQLVAEGEALSAAMSLADRIGRNAPLAVKMTKKIMMESASWPAENIWDIQRPMADSVILSEDAKEGATAFVEKRAPVWKGR